MTFHYQDQFSWNRAGLLDLPAAATRTNAPPCIRSCGKHPYRRIYDVARLPGNRRRVSNRLLRDGEDAFVTALDPDGGLIHSTFLNGSGKSSTAAIAVYKSGNASVTGSTTSVDFPVTAGTYQTSFTPQDEGNSAAFVTKFNPIGTALVYSTYLGPPNCFGANAIALDASGHAFIAGTQ